MSLWGRSDNVTSRGTVTLDYSTGIVVGNDGGSGTQFGEVGAAKTGDIIRFGTRGGGGTYYGDAVILGITSERQLNIGSTAGLSGAAISGKNFYISELPISSIDDHAWSNKHDTAPSYKQFAQKAAHGAAGIGSTSISVYWKDLDIRTNTPGKDALLNDGNNLVISAVGLATAKSGSVSAGGTTLLYAQAPPGTIVNHTTVDVTQYVSAGNTAASHRSKVTAIGATTVSIASTISNQIAKSADLKFRGDHIVSLAGPLTAAIAQNDTLTFNRLQAGYDRQIYGLGIEGAKRYGDVDTEYRTAGPGWVGVTTYVDQHGNLRVKSEILVTMGGKSGITTGANGITYPTNV